MPAVFTTLESAGSVLQTNSLLRASRGALNILDIGAVSAVTNSVLVTFWPINSHDTLEFSAVLEANS